MDYQVVFIANGRLEADMVRLMLEASGIKVLMRGESAGTVYGLTAGPLGEVNLLVPEGQLEEAQNLIDAMNRGELEQNSEEEIDLEAQEDGEDTAAS